MSVTPSVFVGMVTWNSEAFVAASLQSLKKQVGFSLGETLHIFVADNDSKDGSCEIVSALAAETGGIHLLRMGGNFGFCGANNRLVHEFLKESHTHILMLNADCALAPDAIRLMVTAAQDADLVTPLLLRANADLTPLVPTTVDAAGMELTPDLRHFDRGAGACATEAYRKPGAVFGGTGASLMLTRRAVETLLMEGLPHEEDVDRVFPILAIGRSERRLLFDEAFFAYREDADLCWRAHLFGLSCHFEPTAVGYHFRRVTPERRGSLPAFINRCGVRNRFLLQFNNLIRWPSWNVLIRGVIVRNLIVLLALFTVEVSSLPALAELWKLRRRAMQRRRALTARVRVGTKLMR